MPKRVDANQPEAELACEDCGKLYKDFSLDVVIPDDQWELITGYKDGEGILCADCIVERGSKVLDSNNHIRFTVAKLRFE